MPGATPCLGFGSRTAAVQAMRAEGLPTHEIAARIGITTKKVQALEASARRHRAIAAANHVSANSNVQTLSVGDILSGDIKLRGRARRHAAKRGMSVERLVRSIVEIVIDQDMVDAVLDDADEIARAS